MPTSRKTTKAALAAGAAMPSIPKGLLDHFVTGTKAMRIDNHFPRTDLRSPENPR